MRQLKPINSLESLLSFGIWYTERYLPSRAKIEEILTRKCSNAAWISSVLNSLNSYIDDKRLLSSKIQSDVERGIAKSKILPKYLQKKFRKEDIQEVLDSFDFENASRMQVFLKKIEKYIDSGKSKRIALLELQANYPEFKENIHQLLENYPSDEEQLEQFYMHLKSDISQKNFERLVRKWFSYQSVKRFLSASDGFE